jgi:phosphoribosyl-ATP pyrophosphohydrolase/phosphoribosyl-AMP cyclohydrolase
MIPPEVRFDAQGLVPGIVQDQRSGRVLMLGYLNRESLQLTLSTGEVHFWSRSRQELWHKGATSDNTLDLVELCIDCDGDALLLIVHPHGPTCHTGATGCFDGTGGDQPAGFGVFASLWSVILQRACDRPEGSYTFSLLQGGVDAVARKVLEEAGEVVLAAKDHAVGLADDRRLAEEVADLAYHALVLLAERGIDPAEVTKVLEARGRTR